MPTSLISFGKLARALVVMFMCWKRKLAVGNLTSEESCFRQLAEV